MWSMLYRALFIGLAMIGLLILVQANVSGHDLSARGFQSPTFQIQAPVVPKSGTRLFRLRVVDEETGKDTPARFSLEWDNYSYVPEHLDENGIHFTSIHTGKNQRATVLYTRGRGPVTIPLPDGSGSSGRVWVTKGYRYLPAKAEFRAGDQLTVHLTKWNDLSDRGWFAMDEHLHFERTKSEMDAIWFEMLEGDALEHALFMVLKGGNFDGVWGQQPAYDKTGMGRSERSLLIPGEEFRGPYQGHNNLFLPGSLIEPISVGGLGKPPHPYHWPASYSVLNLTREAGGIGGAAHGGSGWASTATLDALLGASGFIELANTHVCRLSVWYRLLNCGVILPPVAGTDLPNYPYRESWQPFFGETRTYIQAQDPTDFELWKSALRSGRVFVSSGPMINLTVNGQSLGSIIRLPEGGSTVEIEAEITSSQPIRSLEVVCNGKVLHVEAKKELGKRGVFRQSIRHRLEIDRSSWLAARGEGSRKNRLWSSTGRLAYHMAHTAAIPVIVADEPIRVAKDIEALRVDLQEKKEKYRTEAKYPSDEERNRMLELFDHALKRIESF